MKIIIIAVLMLTGCEYIEQATAATARANAAITSGYTKVCVDGVLYIQFTSGISVAYSKYGTVKKCEAS